MNQSLEKIKEILESSRLSDFIGLKEDIHFEAKGKSGYDLDSPNGRYELAKDVSSLANAEGGYLIIGLETAPLTEENTDKVKELDLLPEKKFDRQRYEAILREYIHPRISDLKVKWIQDINSPKKGIGYVHVPPQHQDNKYFLIKREFDENESIRQIVFGIAERKGSSNQPLTIKELHKTVKNGKSEMAQRLTRIEEKIDLLLYKFTQFYKSPQSPPEESPVEKMAQRISDAVNSED